MDAARTADAYGCFPGNAAEQADAEQAHTLARLVGAKTWVRLPREEWPAAWENMHDPVCPLVLAFYRHADGGGHGQQRWEQALLATGSTPIPSWKDGSGTRSLSSC